MNFLEICNEVKNQAEIGGADMTSVTGQTGKLAMVVKWVNRAYMRIATHRDDWQWLFSPAYTFNLSPGKRQYTASELLVTDIKKWDIRRPRIYRTSIGLADETKMDVISYSDWERSLAMGEQVSGKPDFLFTLPGTNTLMFHQVPDAEYTVTLNYWKAASKLVNATDIPLIPEEYQDIITYRALMFYAVYDDATEIYLDAKNEYTSLLERMEETGIEEIQFNYRALY